MRKLEVFCNRPPKRGKQKDLPFGREDQKNEQELYEASESKRTRMTSFKSTDKQWTSCYSRMHSSIKRDRSAQLGHEIKSFIFHSTHEGITKRDKPFPTSRYASLTELLYRHTFINMHGVNLKPSLKKKKSKCKNKNPHFGPTIQHVHFALQQNTCTSGTVENLFVNCTL